MIVHTLNAHLAAHGLAMSVLGSISDQTIGGVVTTATHGSGAFFPVISDMVLYLTVLLADGSIVKCSRTVQEDLFLATLCGFGSTGLVAEVCLQVENAFCLRDDSEAINFAAGTRCLDTIVHSAEHVKLWWFPQSDSMRVNRSNRVYSVRATVLPSNALSDPTQEPRVPSRARTLIIHVLVGYHLMQLLLFLARYFVDFNTSVARFAHWLGSAPSSKVDRSWKVFNVDLLVRGSPSSSCRAHT